MPLPPTISRRRLLLTNTTRAAAVIENLPRATTIEALINAGITWDEFVWLNGASSSDLIPFGTDAANEQFYINLWGVARTSAFGGSPTGSAPNIHAEEQQTGEVVLFPLGQALAILGTTAGAGDPDARNYGVLPTELLADSNVFTPYTESTSVKGPTEKIHASYLTDGINLSYSPGDNTPSMLMLNGLGRFDAIIPEIVMDTGGTPAASGNCLVRRSLI